MVLLLNFKHLFVISAEKGALKMPFYEGFQKQRPPKNLAAAAKLEGIKFIFLSHASGNSQ